MTCAVAGGRIAGERSAVDADGHGDDALHRHRGLDAAAKQLGDALRRAARRPPAAAARGVRRARRPGDGHAGRRVLLSPSRAPGTPSRRRSTAQRALAAHEWPDGAECRVRMGLHTGEPASATRATTASACTAARGSRRRRTAGRCCSRTRPPSSLEDDLPAGVALRDLGEQRLKDIDRPERIYQLVVDGPAGGVPAAADGGAAAPDSRRAPSPSPRAAARSPPRPLRPSIVARHGGGSGRAPHGGRGLRRLGRHLQRRRPAASPARSRSARRRARSPPATARSGSRTSTRTASRGSTRSSRS